MSARTPLTPSQQRKAVRIARVLRTARDAAMANWKAEAAAAAEDGYRPHYCVHGTNLWTDYDNICGACEDYGFNGFDPLEVYYRAAARVRAHAERLERVAAAVITLQVEHAITPEETAKIIDRIKEWEA